MSAVFGIVRFDGGTVSARDLERMGNTLAHRGPDGCKRSVADAAGLGHCLMQVNCEDRFEAQPLRDVATGLTLVADARLDNRDELARALGLSDAALREMPESAVLLRAYQVWGDDCVQRLLGDFVFAVWDARQRRLFLARDHMGQRTLYYHRGDGFLAFATEVKALWALPDVPRRIDDAQLGRELLYDARRSQGATLFEGIRALPGGAAAWLDAAGAWTERPYWQPHAAPEHRGHDEASYIAAYRRVFEEAVACRIRRLIAPPALCLSAGFDSAAIAGLAGPVLRQQGRKMTTVSYVMPSDYRGPLRSVRPWVDLCARDMPHLDVRMIDSGSHSIFTKAEATFHAVDGPPHTAHYVRAALFACTAGSGARLVMDGLGGDYTINQRGGAILSHLLRSGQFGRFAAEFRPHMRATGRSLWQTLRHDVVGPLLPVRMRRLIAAVRRGFAAPWRITSLSPGFAMSLLAGKTVVAEEILGRYWMEHRPRQRALRSLQNFAEAGWRMDTNEAAAHGLELARPLMDKRVVELGLAIPEDLYVKNGRNRYLACRALADIYPPEFLTRDRHQDLFEPDMIGMLAACRPQLADELARIKGDPRLRRIFDFDAMERRLAACDGSWDSGLPGALHALCAARYVTWFEGRNRPINRADRTV